VSGLDFDLWKRRSASIMKGGAKLMDFSLGQKRATGDEARAGGRQEDDFFYEGMPPEFEAQISGLKRTLRESVRREFALELEKNALELERLRKENLELSKPQMLTIPQLAELGYLSYSAIRRLVADGKIPAVKVGCKHLINSALFLRYLNGKSMDAE
jgi:excisionase family DNA binding protein